MTYGLPPGLLAAIGRVESGRSDPVSGRVQGWPWTLNANGIGAYWPTQIAAVTAVTALQEAGIASIDVGCFQISLLHHPDAFPTLNDAFVPSTNAAYAARFLLELKQRTGEWSRAVMAYHSATPALGQPYWAQVQAAWARQEPFPLASSERLPVISSTTGAVHVWSPGTPGKATSAIHFGPDNGPLPKVTYFVDWHAVRSTGS